MVTASRRGAVAVPALEDPPMKAPFDQEALISMFAQAGAKGGEQLRKTVSDATLAALQGRELTLKNIRTALGAMSKATSGALANAPAPGVDAEALLDKAVEGMDDALLKAVEANRLALQRFVDQGADLRDKHLKKAVDDLDKFDDLLIGVAKKAIDGAGPLAGAWSSVFEKLQAGGSVSGVRASATAEQMLAQMQTAMRDSRAAGLRAAQTLAESYAALASGVLIGMSDALQQGSAKPRAAAKK
jgi:hypothetical protein